MAKYRNALPQLNGDFFLSDGGIETTLVFHEQMELPCFMASHLYQTAEGKAVIDRNLRKYPELARKYNVGLIMESVTWRANPDWTKKLGYSKKTFEEVNQQAIRHLEEIRLDFETPESPVVISACIGPRGDGYRVESSMTVEQARDYHQTQIDIFRKTNADLVTAHTINYVEEAVGITLAAKEANMPAVISFTLETDGKLPSGQTLGEAIMQVDEKTNGYTAYFMINCAHPTHFIDILKTGASWTDRIHGIRANSSCRSHAELDNATDLDMGNPEELGQQYNALKNCLKNLNVMGGCCGTDHRHIEQIAKACYPLFGEKVKVA